MGLIRVHIKYGMDALNFSFSLWQEVIRKSSTAVGQGRYMKKLVEQKTRSMSRYKLSTNFFRKLTSDFIR